MSVSVFLYNHFFGDEEGSKRVESDASEQIPEIPSKQSSFFEAKFGDQHSRNVYILECVLKWIYRRN